MLVTKVHSPTDVVNLLLLVQECIAGEYMHVIHTQLETRDEIITSPDTVPYNDLRHQ